MHLIICISHLYVPITISLIGTYKETVFIVYTDQASIKRLLKSLFPDLIIYFYYEKGLIGSLRGNYRLKSFLRKNMIRDVTFFHEGFGDSSNLILLFIAKKTKVHYIPVSRSFDIYNVNRLLSFKIIFYYIYTYVLWRYCYQYVNEYGNIFPLLRPSFFKKIGAVEEKCEFDKSTIDSILQNLPAIKNKYLYNSVVLLGSNHCKTDEDRRNYFEIENTIIKKSPCVYFKGHPRIHIVKNFIEEGLKEIPSYFTGSILTNQFRCFVGINSALLFEAANAGAVSICLIDLISSYNSKEKSNVKKYLSENSTLILFPKDLNDLSLMLNSTFETTK